MIRVVKDASTFTPDLQEGMVVIESDHIDPDFCQAIEELQSVAAKQMAITYANSIGMAPCACKPHGPGAYPVNAEDRQLDQLRDENGQPLPPQDPAMQVARYRIDVPVARRLI